ncbi:Cell division inhibitor [Minicystis rosea]|nr:Cell division inhibitor [Minicystis rosea]
MKKVVITGGTGFVGRKLVEELGRRGDRVVVLTRDAGRAQAKLPSGARAVTWTPEAEGPWMDELASADAVVHLAGEPVAQRWTEEARRRIVASRVDSTRLLVETIGRGARKPSVLVSASAIGFYGARPPNEDLDEQSAPGEGFLADVVQRWEAEARAVTQHGVRSVQLRIGVVLGEGGGAVEKMILPFKLFAGGHIGDGKQAMSWVHRDDVVGLALLAIDDVRVEGPINVVAPNPVSGAEMAKAIGRVLKRPAWLPAPSFAVKMAMGDAASVVLTGQRVLPKRALELGYAFRHGEIVPALASILERS